MAVAQLDCSVPASQSPRPGSCEAFRLTEIVPLADSQDVPVDVVPALTFNDFPNPDTIDVNTVALYTGFFYHTGRFWVDLLERRAFFRPSGTLSPGLGYTLVVRPGILSLRGCALSPPNPGAMGKDADIYAYRFQTAPRGAEKEPRPVPSTAGFDQVLEVFAGHCGGAGCHLSGDAPASDPATCLDEPAGGLSLCGRDAHGGLVGIPSQQVRRLVRVAPRDSSRSYLLRKLIGAPPIVGHAGVPRDDGATADAGGGTDHPPLSHDELAVIQSWIDSGAPEAPGAP
ncbi:MAG: Ig-like domain-containing protein [Pseudomonadota bacterium]